MASDATPKGGDDRARFRGRWRQIESAIMSFPGLKALVMEAPPYNHRFGYVRTIGAGN